MHARMLGPALSLCVGACAFDSTGVGSTAATVQDGSGDGGSATDGAPSGGSDTPSATASLDGSTGGGHGAAMLVLVDAPLFDFAQVALGAVETRAFVLRNEGSGPALDVGADVTGAPFSLAGGAFPGAGGTCGDTLAAADSCVVVVACAPTQWGTTDGVIAVHYGDVLGGGMVETGLRVDGIGETANLLDNGDAEQGGAPPVAWEPITNGGNDWQATPEFAFEGTRSIWAGRGTAVTAFRLRQVVEVDPWGALIDAGGVTFRVRARTRSYDQDNDPHAVRLRFMGAGGELISEVTSPEHRGTDWSTVDESSLAPAGTRSVQVQLRCDKDEGDYCDGFFDEISLVARHP